MPLFPLQLTSPLVAKIHASLFALTIWPLHLCGSVAVALHPRLAGQGEQRSPESKPSDTINKADDEFETHEIDREGRRRCTGGTETFGWIPILTQKLTRWILFSRVIVSFFPGGPQTKTSFARAGNRLRPKAAVYFLFYFLISFLCTAAYRRPLCSYLSTTSPSRTNRLISFPEAEDNAQFESTQIAHSSFFHGA